MAKSKTTRQDETALEFPRKQWAAMLARKRLAIGKAIAKVRAIPNPGPEPVRRALTLLNNYACKLPSHERLPNFLPLIAPAPPTIFWPALMAHWASCDNTWSVGDELLAALVRQDRRGVAEHYFDDASRGFFQSLPETVAVYRGCSRSRIRGLAWTTDQDVASGFARGHRGIPVPEPVIATGLISKSDIFFVAAERNESEVVIDPAGLIGLSYEGTQE
jgi:hypothetical protein